MRFCCIVLFVFFSTVAAARQPGSSRDAQARFGTFGGFGFNYMELAAKEAMGLNVQGGIIFNQWMAAGIQLNAFCTLNPLNDRLSNSDANLLGGYGGVFIAPTICSNALIHASFPVFAGYGGINYEVYDIMEKQSGQVKDSDRFWIFEPGIEAEINLLPFIRLAIGGYYRCSSRVYLSYEKNNSIVLPEDVLNNFSVGVRLRIGKF